MATVDPFHAKMVLPVLKRRSDVLSGDYLDEPLQKVEGDIMSQLMKSVATLSSRNATKRAGGGAAGGQ